MLVLKVRVFRNSFVFRAKKPFPERASKRTRGGSNNLFLGSKERSRKINLNFFMIFNLLPRWLYMNILNFLYKKVKSIHKVIFLDIAQGNNHTLTVRKYSVENLTQWIYPPNNAVCLLLNYLESSFCSLFQEFILKCLKSNRVRVVTTIEKIHREKNLEIFEREKKILEYFNPPLVPWHMLFIVSVLIQNRNWEREQLGWESVL